VNSSAFGRGEVIDIDGLALTIKFDNGATKKLNVQFARLDKI
jgi:DNA helicase-2/ATP-dependent DNA helicase PcrA